MRSRTLLLSSTALVLCGFACGCGSDLGDGGGGSSGEPFSAVFVLSADRGGDTLLEGQVAPVGAVAPVTPSGCSNPGPDDPVPLATFLPDGDAALMDIGDVGLRGLGGLAVARTIDDDNRTYTLVDEHVGFPGAGTEVSAFAEDDRFDAAVLVDEPPTLNSPADGSPFLRTEDLSLDVSAPGASGLVVELRFTNEARALCFFDHDGALVVPRETIAEGTFGVTGSADLLVGAWVAGSGGSGGVDVHLVTVSSAASTLQLQ